MHRPLPTSPWLAAAVLAALSTIPATPAAAAGFLRFLHGGRATAQAGALVARADTPGAVFYNPAGIVHTDGSELEAGLDFANATDDYESATAGKFRADHSIQFPPAVYLTWNGSGPWAFGLGVDTPAWYRVDFDPALFPGRFHNRVVDLELWEVHPVLAYDLGGGYSVGAGLRYVLGGFEQGLNARLQILGTGGQSFPAEILVDADSDLDGYGFDGAVQYRATVWGWGATYRTGVELDGSGDVRRTVRDGPGDPEADRNLAALLGSSPASQSIDLPWELAGGFWLAPYPELRVELDLALAGWSDFEQTFGPRPAGATTDVQRSGWDDTLSIRLGLEGEVTEHLALAAGVAWEPSPIPGDRVDPAFFRGDSTVYAAGLSYGFPQLSFDLGYSLHDYDDRSARGQEIAPLVTGTYASSEQVWSLTARWRF
jgi:long-chain fatty acid transport protein